MKEVLLIEGNMASNYMFVTMSCLSYYSILVSFKIINDAAAKYSFRPKITGDYLYF